MPGLTTVPLEILLGIVYHLNTTEYGNLRLSCKVIETALLASFSKEYFTKRQFMITEFSLQALLDISKSRFSCTLSNVIFGLERPTPGATFTTDQARTSRDGLKSIQDRFGEILTNHLTFLNAGQDVEMLAQAFLNLENLEAVGIRDFYSRSRRRDFPETEWKSYGVQTFESETGRRLTMINHQFAPQRGSDSSHAYVSRVFLTILRALGKANTKPKNFEVILRKAGVQDHAFNLPEYVEPIVKPVLQTLRTFFLDLDWGLPLYPTGSHTAPAARTGHLLRVFLAKLVDLQHLRLNFHDKSGDTSDIMTWLSHPANSISSPATSDMFPGALPLVHFAKLQQLDIGMVQVDPKVLIALIRKYQTTLRIFSLHKVTLLQTDSSDAEARTNLWTRFFGKLSSLNLNLSGMNVTHLSQCQVGGHRQWDVTFKESRDPNVKRWAGTDTQSGLRDFADQLIIEGLDVETESGHSEEGNEDDDDDVVSMVDGDDNDDGSADDV